MRFVWAVAAFVLATLMIGAGIAQRTVLQGAKTESQTIEISEPVPFILIDGSVLNSHDGAQTLRAQGDGTIFAAYGRTADMTAWLAPSAYAQVRLGDEGEIASTVVTAPAPLEGEEARVLDPAGSDLWLDQFQQEDLLITPLQLPADMSLLVATDGRAPAPTDLTVTWPTGATTPWAGPLIVGGATLMLVGIVLYVLGLRHVRRSRGPRRKGLPLPVTEPIDLSAEAADKGVITAAPTRRQLSRGARAFAVVPVVAVSALLFSGCAPDAWPQFSGSPTPSPTDSVIVPEGQVPAVTQTQAERILSRISAHVATADEEMDAAAAAARLDGPALAARETNYTLRETLKDHATLGEIPAKPLRILLPESYDGWPRTFLAVVEDRDDKTATIMIVTQQDAWADYKLTHMARLAAGAPLPELAPWYVGAKQVQPDSPFLVMAPDQVAAAYADVLDNGDESPFAAAFDTATDSFRTQVAADRAARLEAFNKTGAKTGKVTFAATAGGQAPVALATLESGAIIAVTVEESETVTPTDEDAVIKVSDEENPVVKTLTGVSQSSTGFTTTYADQLFFYVPAQGSNERIQFLGYGSNILSAKVVKK